MSPQLKSVVVVITTAAVTLLVSGRMAATESIAAQPEGGDEEAAEMMQAWMELNQTTEMHERLKDMVGMWDVEMKTWMAPGAEPMVSEGSAEIELILDGRFIQQTFTCPFMGVPYEGRGIEGYDPFKKKFVSLWIDNVSNSMSMYYGTPDASGSSVTYFGTADDPMTGEQDVPMRMTAREVSKDKAVLEMYMKPYSSDEFKSMELVYTRATDG